MDLSECAPSLRLLPQHTGWRRAESRSFCLLRPSYTLVSKIRPVWQQEEYICMYPVWTLLQLLGWGGDPQGWVKPEADQDGFLTPLPTEPHGRSGLQVAQELLQSACFFRTLWKYCIYLCFSTWLLLREYQWGCQSFLYLAPKGL